MPIFPPNGGTSTPPNSFVASPKLFYCSPGGNDSTGDGSEFNPYHTISAAITACQAAGGGTVRYADRTWASPVSGAGVWLRGINDPGPGGAGWVTCNATMALESWVVQGGTFSFGGAGWAPGGGAGSFSNTPFWIAGCFGGLTFRNISVAALGAWPAMRLGLSSPLNPYNAENVYSTGNYVVYNSIAYVSIVNDNTNHTPVSSPSQWTPIRAPIADGLAAALTAMVRWENAYFECAGVDSGPTVDCGGGFWYYFEQCVIARSDVGSSLLKNCAFRAWDDNTGGFTYLTSFRNSRLTGMGFYLAGGHEVNMSDVTAENMNTMGVWQGETVAGSGSPRGTIERTTFADSDPGIYCVTNNGTGVVHVIDSDVSSGNCYVDRGIQVTSVLNFGQAGRSGPAIEAYHEGARRLHAPGTLPYKNIATALQWFAGSYVAGPDGAAAGTHTAKTLSADYIIYDESNGWDAPADGDYYAWGVWMKWLDINPSDSGIFIKNTGTGDITFFLGGPTAAGVPGLHTLSAGQTIGWLGSIPGEVGRWTWYPCWIKIVGTPGASTNLMIQASPSETSHVSHAQPWMIHVPAADGLSSGEVAALAMHSFGQPNNGENTTAFSAAPPAPTVGMPALWPGQKFAFWDATLHAWKYLTIDNGAIVIS